MTPEQLASRRKALGLSQAALGQRLGLPPNTIARWERGRLRIARPEWLEVALNQLESSSTLESSVPAPASMPSGPPPIDTASIRRTFHRVDNLPSEVNSFVGRDQEIAECRALLTQTRLMTLEGTGGVGKSRLALRIASAVQHEYRDGVCLVELGSLPDPGLVPQTVAAALHIRERLGQTILETLLEALRPRQLLVLLDNCEHLVLVCAELAEALLRAGAELRILATSREPLGATGELAWRVPSLRAPDLTDPLDRATACEATQLFVERAREVVPDYTIGKDNLRAVVRVIHQLDGIPLALELAAARLKGLNIEQIDHRLDECFKLLVGGARTALPRHQTLRAAIDWSYDLLDEAERRLFDGLSVFAGGWPLEAAETVCGDPPNEVLELLKRLIDKSLVVVEHPNGATRYRMLESLRQFGREHLEARADGESVRRRHLEWIASIAARIDPGELVPATVAALGREEDNLRAALRWCVECQDLEAGFDLATAAAPLWNLRGRYAEGRAWLEALLAAPVTTRMVRLRASALKWNGILAMSQGDLDVAESNIQAGFDLAQAHGTHAEAPAFVKLLGLIRTEHGDLDEALPLYREGLLIYQEMGQPFWEAVTHAHIARVLFDLGDIDDARQSAQAALDLAKGHDFTWATSRALVTLGRVAAQAGEDAHASDLLWQALKEQQAIGDSMGAVHTLRYLGHFYLERGQAADAQFQFLAALNVVQDTGDRLALARTLEGLAGVLAPSKPVQAATLIGAATRLLVQARARLWRREQAYVDRVHTTIRGLIGEGALQDALCQGGQLSAETASDAARTWISPPDN